MSDEVKPENTRDERLQRHVDFCDANQCGACKWWDGDMDVKHARGQCRKFPPTHVDGDERGFWPSVRASDWCGSFAHLGWSDCPNCDFDP